MTVSYTVRIKALQFELGPTRTAYQFNYSQFNVTEAPFASVRGIMTNGVDQWMQTAAIDFAGAEVLGTELVTNGDFTSATGWTQQAGWTISAGVLNGNVAAAAFTNAFSTVALTAGKAYKVTYTITSYTSGAVRAGFYGGTGVFGASQAAVGTFSEVIVAVTGNASAGFQGQGAGFVGIIDNVSVKEVIIAADEITVVAGVRKLSDAATGIVVELTGSSVGNNGAFYITAPQTAADNTGFGSKGTAAAIASASGIASPASAVISGQGKISTDTAIQRRNGVQVSSVATDQGTGNFSNAIVYLFRRGGTSVSANVVCTSLLAINRLLPTADLTGAERAANQPLWAY